MTLDDLPAGPTGRWHNARFRVQLYGGALASVSDDAVFTGANAAALQRADGAWEVIQFANAELVGARTYSLSRLLRGQAGSEWAMGAPLAAGAPFVLLDAHVVTIASGLDALERTLQLRLVAAGRDIGDASALSLDATPQATALRPLTPVHVKAARDDERRHLHLDPPHAHRRRQLGRRGAARRGQRAIHARHSVGRRCGAHAFRHDADGALCRGR